MSEFENLAITFQVTQDALLRHSARAVDSALVVRNWLFGWYLVEFENASASRADLYGKELINKLAKRLKEKGFAGYFTNESPQVQGILPSLSRDPTGDVCYITCRTWLSVIPPRFRLN